MQDTPRPERFPALDGLRTFAAAAVVWHHCGPRGTFFDRGLGVNTFFAISGFLITTLLLREQTRTGEIAIGSFYLRRALRIVPPYFAVIALYTVLVAVLEGHSASGAAFWAHLPYFVSFTSNWVVSGETSSHVIMMFAWSLSTQEQFYLLWPWVMRFVRRRRAAVLFILVVLVVVEISWIPLTAADGIWMGCLVAYLLDTRPGWAVLSRVAAARWSALAALAAVLLPLAWPSLPALETEAAIAWLVAACALRPGVLAPVLEHRLVRWIGSITYGVYLLHMLGVNAARRLVPGAGQATLFAIAIPLSIAGAALLHRWLEEPVGRVRSRLLARGAIARVPGGVATT